MLNDCKLYLGCVTRNVIDASIEYANDNNVKIGLIPTRRQIEHDKGYTLLNTQKFASYVKEKSKNVVVQRDHAGPNQGREDDDGLDSLSVDSEFFDIIHLDPWKKYNNFEEGLNETIKLIEHCLQKNFSGTFEIGTEQSIRKFEPEEIDCLLKSCEKYDIEYIVIQSGTSLKENVNTGSYSGERLKDMIEVASKYNVKTKEHNGDYITPSLIKQKFDLGLSSINIAPEFGLIETNCYLDKIGNNSYLNNLYFDLCYQSNQWKKWVDKDFDPSNKLKLMQICGHYVIQEKTFQEQIKSEFPNIDDEIKYKMKDRIKEIL